MSKSKFKVGDSVFIIPLDIGESIELINVTIKKIDNRKKEGKYTISENWQGRSIEFKTDRVYNKKEAIELFNKWIKTK